MIRAQLTPAGELIPIGKWRIVFPRQVMKKFFGTDREYMCEFANNFNSFIACFSKNKFYFTDRFEGGLSYDEKAMLHTIAVGQRNIDMHLNLPESI